MANEKKKCDLDGLKEDYSRLQKGHKLPSFEKMNEDFGIEKLSDVETDFLLREVRKVVIEKISQYFQFIEAILDPSNNTIFIFSVIKTLAGDDKKTLTEVYKVLSKMELEIADLDLVYSEDKEANFIKKSYEQWQQVKIDLLPVLDSIKVNWDSKTEINHKGYYG
jgi:hypothetical protein